MGRSVERACEALFLGRCALGPQFSAAEIALQGRNGCGADKRRRREGVVIGVDGKRSAGTSFRECGGDGLVWREAATGRNWGF
jgi:hypothetical protein